MIDTKKIEAIDWTQYSGPEYYEPDKVPQALNQLLCLHKEEHSSKTYNRVLFAIGNNHAGTYYPAVIAAIRIIIDIALNSELEVARNCSLDMMTDLYCSFCPELGTYNQCIHDELESIVKTEVESIQKQLEIISTNKNESHRNRRLSGELIEAINELKLNKT
ncbi:MAG: hypothetical protein GY793_10525 [Proteobacteria bacterium]|nr:hypothetical protein [Pseudomonadota bacterium]